MPFLVFLRTNLRWLGAGLLLTFFSAFGQTYFISLSAGELRETFDLSHGAFGGLYMGATLCSAISLTYVGKFVDTHPACPCRRCGRLRPCAVQLRHGQRVVRDHAVFRAVRPAPVRAGHDDPCGDDGNGALVRGATRAGRIHRGAGHAVQRGHSAAHLCRACGRSGVARHLVGGAGVLLLVALPVLLLLLRVERVPRGAAPGADADEAGPVRRQWTRGEVLRDPAFWVISLGTLAPPFIATTIFFHQVYLVELRGWTQALFASSFLAMSAMTVTCALTAGWLVDKVTAVRLLPAFLLPLSVACVVLALVEAPFAAFVFMALLGMSNGVSSTLFGALWPEVYGTRHLGAVRSVTVSLMVLASAAGPGLTGWLIDIGVPYQNQILAMAVYCLLACAAMALVSRRLVSRAARGG